MGKSLRSFFTKEKEKHEAQVQKEDLVCNLSEKRRRKWNVFHIFAATTYKLTDFKSKIQTMFGLRLPEIIIIALVVLLLFGGKRIPELMKGLGRGVKSFKDGLNETSAPPKPENTEKTDNEKQEEKTEA